jgi:hypothetical protein
MKYLNNFLPWVLVLVILALFEGILQQPKSIFLLAPAAGLALIAGIWQLTGREIRFDKFWRYAITPLLFIAGGLLFISFLEGRYLRQFLLIGLIVLLWAYLEILFLRFNYRPKYEPYSLENVTSHLNLITIYLVACGFYSLILFLGINFWLLLLIFVLISMLMAYQLAWASGITGRSGWPYIAVITLICAEVFWVVNYLPTSIYVNGLLVTLNYYLMSGLSRNWLLEIKGRKVILRYLILSGLVLALILFTAKWF